MPYNNPKGIIAESIILEVLAAACVGLRFLARRRRKASLATDDWLIVIALVGATGLTVMQVWGCATGGLAVPLGQPINDVPTWAGRVGRAERIELATFAVGVPTLGFTRLSITFLYKRIFITRAFQIIIWIWIALVVLWMVAFELCGLLQCGSHLLAMFGSPASYYQYCGSAIKGGFALVGSSVAEDVITVILPLPMLYTLNMPPSRKVLLALNFMIGWLSVGAGIGTAVVYITFSKGISELDGILTITGFSVWSLIEVHVGIIASCCVITRPLLEELVPTNSLDNVVRSLRRNFPNSPDRSGRFGSLRPPSGESLQGAHPEERHITMLPRTQSHAEASGEEIEMNDVLAGREASVPHDEIHMRTHISVEEA